MELTQYKKTKIIFEEYHKNKYNILFHCITIFLGLTLFIALLPDILVFSGLIYYLYYLYNKQIPYFDINMCVLTTIFLVSRYSYITLYENVFYMGCCILCQDLSHYITGDKIFLYDYISKKSLNYREKSELWFNQTIYLVPLIIDLYISKNVKNILLPKKQIIKAKLDNLDNNINELEEEIYLLNFSKKNTSHWWVLDLSVKIKNLCVLLSSSKCIYDKIYSVYDKTFYNILEIPEMNEIYVATQTHSENSDTVFFSKHIDGPFGLLPFIHVNRTLIAINKNNFVKTNFPIEKVSYILDKGEVVSFDFNREIHYIDLIKENCSDKHRILLKAHHLIYPKCLYFYALIYCKLNILYDKIARKAFLKTLNPENASEKSLVNIILYVTNNWYKIEEYIGFNNVLYIGFLLYISYLMNNNIFYVLFTYIQYIIYNNCIKKNEIENENEIVSNSLYRDINIYKYLSLVNFIYICYYGLYSYLFIFLILLYF